jgi:hypothetical protein
VAQIPLRAQHHLWAAAQNDDGMLSADYAGYGPFGYCHLPYLLMHSLDLGMGVTE